MLLEFCLKDTEEWPWDAGRGRRHGWRVQGLKGVKSWAVLTELLSGQEGRGVSGRWVLFRKWWRPGLEKGFEKVRLHARFLFVCLFWCVEEVLRLSTYRVSL